MGNAQSQHPQRRRSVSLSTKGHSKSRSRPDSTRMTIPAASQLNTGSLARVPVPRPRPPPSLQVKLTPLRRSESMPGPPSASPEATPTTPIAGPASECKLAFAQFSQIYPGKLDFSQVEAWFTDSRPTQSTILPTALMAFDEQILHAFKSARQYTSTPRVPASTQKVWFRRTTSFCLEQF